MTQWTYSPDGDKYHPDWEHTMDGEYRPKGTTCDIEGGLVLPNGQSTTQEKIDQARNDADMAGWI